MTTLTLCWCGLWCL